MQNTLSAAPGQTAKPNLCSGIFFAALLLTVLCFFTYSYHPLFRQDRTKVEMSSGKNGKHVNQKAQKNAEEQYQKVKEAFDKLNKKPKKSREDNKQLEKLKNQVEHWRKKKDWGGENHSQKHKGN